MRSNAYCGNLPWQSSPALQAPDAKVEKTPGRREGNRLVKAKDFKEKRP